MLLESTGYRKSAVRLIDRPDMTKAFNRGRKATNFLLCSHSHNDVPPRISAEHIHGGGTGRRASVHQKATNKQRLHIYIILRYIRINIYGIFLYFSIIYFFISLLYIVLLPSFRAAKPVYYPRMTHTTC